MKRILHYGLSNNLGGIETYLKMIHSGIDKNEYIFDFLISKETTPYFQKEYEKSGSKFYYIAPRKGNPLQNINDVKKIMSNEKIDVFHFHTNTLSYITPIIESTSNNIPTIIHSHSSGSGTSKLTRALHIFNKKKISKYNTMQIAVSEKAGNWLFNDKEYEVIANGINPDKYKFDINKRKLFRESIGVTEDEYLVVHVGIFLPEKNHKFLIRTFSEFLKKAPNSKLLLIGDGKLKKEMMDYVFELEIEKDVLFLGIQKEIPTIFSGSDLFLFPSLFEGFGLVALEAQASGLDSIVSDTIPSIVKANENFLALPVNESEKTWVNYMVKFYQNKLDFKKRKDAYKNIIDAGLSDKDTIESVKMVYKEILE